MRPQAGRPGPCGVRHRRQGLAQTLAAIAVASESGWQPRTRRYRQDHARPRSATSSAAPTSACQCPQAANHLQRAYWRWWALVSNAPEQEVARGAAPASRARSPSARIAPGPWNKVKPRNELARCGVSCLAALFEEVQNTKCRVRRIAAPLLPLRRIISIFRGSPSSAFSASPCTAISQTSGARSDS